MKKIRIFAAVALVVMLCCVLAVSASAKWWDDNPFTDVKSSSWYYDAVRICNENGLFKGTTETTFGTSIGMDRAMLVTVLAAGDESFDADKYTTSSFSDIRNGSWYMAAVEWANEKGIASGIADGAFGPKNTVTRQELALMLMKYAEYKGMDITVSEETVISSYPDANTVSSWAADAVKWAVQNGLISGTAQGDKIMLSPKGTATRATVAQIMVKFLALEPVYTINGNDISLYKIVYNANERGSEGPVSSSANDLAKYIKLSLGIELPVVTDETEVSEYEILVGKTNREEAGVVTVDRSAFENTQDFICQVQGNYLVISGIDSDANYQNEERSVYNIAGTKSAVYYFLEKEFGLTFYFSGNGTIAEPDPVICLEDGYTFIDGPAFKMRTNFLHSRGSFLSSGNYYDDWSCGYPHQLGNLMFGYWQTHEDDLTASGNPCMTDPENIESLLANIELLLEEKTEKNLIGLIQNDSDSYCKCSDCMEVYRETGSRCGTLLNLCNLAAETFEEQYPNVKYATWAYTWSHKPPNEDYKVHKNVVVYYNTINLCCAHAYNDSEGCRLNGKSAEYIRRWGELVDELLVWDHTGAFIYPLTPFVDFDSIRINAAYFDNNGVEGVFMNGIGNRIPDFCELRNFMLSRLYCEPQMSEGEFDYLMNGYLKAFYGDGWSYLRKYIDTITELGNSKCHETHPPTSSYYDYDEVLPLIETIDGYWDKAEALANTDEQLDDVRFARLSWRYLKQCVLYESQCKNGTEASIQAYVEANTKLFEDIEKYGVDVGDNVQFKPANSPENWVIS